jgi:hypothetical protein
MNYYQISLRGHPVAIVKTIELAQTIVRCRRRGYYAIEKLESGEDIASSTRSHQKTSAPKRPGKTASKFARSGASKSAAKAHSRKPSKSH